MGNINICKLCFESRKFKFNFETVALNLFESLPEPDKLVFTNINKIQKYITNYCFTKNIFCLFGIFYSNKQDVRSILKAASRYWILVILKEGIAACLIICEVSFNYFNFEFSMQ